MSCWVASVESDTLVVLLASKEGPFASIIHLLISKLVFGDNSRIRSRIRFCFEYSTLFIRRAGDLSILKDMLENCEKFRFKYVSIDFNGKDYAYKQDP